MDKWPFGYLITLPLAGGVLWYVGAYYGDTIRSAIGWFEAVFPI